jgi:hypothetical protein
MQYISNIFVVFARLRICRLAVCGQVIKILHEYYHGKWISRGRPSRGRQT